MRFRLEDRRWNASAPYRLRFQETMIQVRCPTLPRSLTHREFCWTWTDGTEYSLIYPSGTLSGETPRVWEVMTAGRTLCSGDLGTPSLWDRRPKSVEIRLAGELEGDLLAKDAGWCAARLIRQSDRRRFAVWHWRMRGVEGVWRNQVHESTASILFGIVLAAMRPE